jgi:hypothetical protein
MNDSIPKKDSSTRDCYIVRIYRRDPNDLKKITGIVETVSLGREDAFKSVEELTAIFTRPIRGISIVDESNSKSESDSGDNSGDGGCLIDTIVAD